MEVVKGLGKQVGWKVVLLECTKSKNKSSQPCHKSDKLPQKDPTFPSYWYPCACR